MIKDKETSKRKCLVFNRLTGQADKLTGFAILNPSSQGRNQSFFVFFHHCLSCTKPRELMSASNVKVNIAFNEWPVCGGREEK